MRRDYIYQHLIIIGSIIFVLTACGGGATEENDVLIAGDDIVYVNEDGQLALSVLLENDVATEGDVLRIVSFSEPAHGAITQDAGGNNIYVPDENYYGPDSIQYTLSNGDGLTDTANVSITVVSVNDLPSPGDDVVTVDRGKATQLNNLLNNDSDLESGQELYIVEWTSPQKGSLILDGAGSFTFTPDQGISSGADSFSYTVVDQDGGMASATVNLNIPPAWGKSVRLTAGYNESTQIKAILNEDIFVASLETFDIGGSKLVISQFDSNSHQWLSETVIIEHSNSINSPNLVATENGGLLLVWVQYDTPNRDLWGAIYTPAGGWETPARISATGPKAIQTWNMIVSSDTAGSLVLAWYQRDLANPNNQFDLWGAHYAPVSKWEQAESLDPTTTSAVRQYERLQSYKLSNGDTIIVWRDNANHYWSSRYVSGSGWRKQALDEPFPVRISVDPAVVANAGSANQLAIQIDAAGNGYATFLQYDTVTRANSIWYNRLVNSGDWQTPDVVRLISASPGVSNTKLFLAKDDEPIITYTEYETDRNRLKASIYDTQTDSWGAGQTISKLSDTAGDRISNIRDVVDQNNNITLVWSHIDSTNHIDLWSNTYQFDAGVNAMGWRGAEVIEAQNAQSPYVVRTRLLGQDTIALIWGQTVNSVQELYLNRFNPNTGWRKQSGVPDSFKITAEDTSYMATHDGAQFATMAVDSSTQNLYIAWSHLLTGENTRDYWMGSFDLAADSWVSAGMFIENHNLNDLYLTENTVENSLFAIWDNWSGVYGQQEFQSNVFDLTDKRWGTPNQIPAHETGDIFLAQYVEEIYIANGVPVVIMNMYTDESDIYWAYDFQ